MTAHKRTILLHPAPTRPTRPFIESADATELVWSPAFRRLCVLRSRIGRIPLHVPELVRWNRRNARLSSRRLANQRHSLFWVPSNAATHMLTGPALSNSQFAIRHNSDR